MSRLLKGLFSCAGLFAALFFCSFDLQAASPRRMAQAPKREALAVLAGARHTSLSPLFSRGESEENGGATVPGEKPSGQAAQGEEAPLSAGESAAAVPSASAQTGTFAAQGAAEIPGEAPAAIFSESGEASGGEKTAALSSPEAGEAQDAVENATPEAWNKVVEDAPVTADEFQSMTLLDHLKNLLSLLADSALAPLRLLAKLCAVLVLAAAIRSFASGNASGDVMQLLDVVVTLAVFGLCSSALLGLMGTLQAALEESRTYLSCFVPVFASVMASCGQINASLVYTGIFFGTAMLLADVLCRVGLPVTRVLLALHAAGAVGSVFDLHSLTDAVAKWIKWLLAFCATVFTAIVGLQSALAQNADSLALKTGKFLVGSSVPVVGRAISDAMGGVLAGLRLIKGTVGFAAAAVLAAVFVPILLQCVVYHLVFTLAGMTAGATGNARAGKLFEGCAQCVSLYISMTFFFSLMVITATILMVVLGNGG